MNKFLMMSAAAVMGTVAAAPQANAGAFQGTVFLENAAGTQVYCTEIFLFKNGRGGSTYSGQVTNACNRSSMGPLQGFPIKGTFGGIRKSIALSFPLNYPFATTWQISPLPTNKKSLWNIWASTNGTTSFTFNGGKESMSLAPTMPRAKERALAKLASILKDRQK